MPGDGIPIPASGVASPDTVQPGHELEIHDGLSDRQQPAVTAEKTAVEVSTSKNVASTGFPSHRTPPARLAQRAMPGTASPTDAAARSAAARSAAASSPRGKWEAAPSAVQGAGSVITPRHESDHIASPISVLLEPEGVHTDPPWPSAGMHIPTGHRADTPVTTRTKRKKIKNPRSAAVGLTALLIFAFVATFFAWFSAGPLWLTLGHGHPGVATVSDCPVAGIDKRCADFTAVNNTFTARVTLLGPASVHARSGATLPARMVSEHNSTAYSGDAASLYLRWVPGLVIVLLCGLAIAWSTGALRLPDRRAKTIAFVASLLAPVALMVGMLAVTW
jgi:hypothetical protein